MAGMDASETSFVFHYTVYFGIDAVRPLVWLFFWPVLWVSTTMLFLACAYGSYRRDAHAGIAWLVLGALCTLPWMLVLHYLALINR